MRTCSSRIIIGISLDTFAVLCMLEETDILLLRLLNGENWSFAVAPGQRLSMTRLVFYGSVSFELDLVSKKIAADLPRAYHLWPESSDKVASSQRLSQSSYREHKHSQLFYRNRSKIAWSANRGWIFRLLTSYVAMNPSALWSHSWSIYRRSCAKFARWAWPPSAWLRLHVAHWISCTRENPTLIWRFRYITWAMVELTVIGRIFKTYMRS